MGTQKPTTEEMSWKDNPDAKMAAYQAELDAIIAPVVPNP